LTFYCIIQYILSINIYQGFSNNDGGGEAVFFLLNVIFPVRGGFFGIEANFLAYLAAISVLISLFLRVRSLGWYSQFPLTNCSTSPLIGKLLN